MMENRIAREQINLGSGKVFRYSIFAADETPKIKKPLLICLHPGWSGQAPEPHYGELFLESMFVPAYRHIGAVMVAPDCPTGAWNNGESISAISLLIQHLKKKAAIDESSISIVGYSAGGWGAWYLLQSGIEKFASAVLVASIPVRESVSNFEENFAKAESVLSTGRNEWLRMLPELPILMIHSKDDELMPFEQTEEAYSILTSAGREVELVLIEGIGHFEYEKYIEALRSQASWLEGTWD